MQLQGKAAIVTGAGSGIGKAAAVLFAKEGATVCLVSRTEDELRQTVGEIERAGGTAIFAVADISKPDEMQRAVAATIEAFGKLDVVFANAGINGVWAPIEKLEPDGKIRVKFPAGIEVVAPEPLRLKIEEIIANSSH